MVWHDPALWALTFACCGSLAIWGRRPKRMIVHWTFKPLTTAVIIAAVGVLASPSILRTSFAAAFTSCLIGDVLLMLPGRRTFVAGLGAFLVAHLAFATGMSAGVELTAQQLLIAPIPAAIAVVIVRSLWPHLAHLRLPVVAYAVAMAAMVWRSFCRLDATGVSVAAWAWGSAGAVLFLVADTLLARRRFAHADHIPYSVELGSYYAALWCLGASTWV